MDAIFAAIVTGVFGLFGSVIVAMITASSTKAAITQKLEIAQAVTDTKIEELTREVRKHNNFAERIPKLEAKVENLEKKGA